MLDIQFGSAGGFRHSIVVQIVAGVDDRMNRGRNNLLVGQTGEYLVAAELSRRGLIATTFTANVPHYDIVASDEAGRHVSVQVKASRSASWQFGKITNYCNITFLGQRQIVGKGKPCPIQRLVVAFVRIDPGGNDQYYILTWQRLRDLLVKGHKSYLGKHDGVRPRNWKSLHSAIQEKSLYPYRDRWDIVENNLK